MNMQRKYITTLRGNSHDRRKSLRAIMRTYAQHGLKVRKFGSTVYVDDMSTVA